MEECSMSSCDQTTTPRRALAMANMTEEDYSNTYWPQLRRAVDRLLQGPPSPPHTGPVIQFEPMYSAAYKCVCQQYSEALYNDLTSHLFKHFLKIAADLQDLSDLQLIDTYYSLIHRVMYSLDGIIPIFTYLNRVYVEAKLCSTLRAELQKIFCSVVLDPVIARLLALVKYITDVKTFYVAPHVLASLVKSLYKLKPTYAQTYPQVFSVYIPGVLPAMREQELSEYINETQQLQSSLRQTWISTSSQGRKRCLDEEMLT